MDPKKLNKLLAIIVKSREIQRSIVQKCSLEQAGFRDYAEKMVALIAEAGNKNKNMIIDKFHGNDTNLRR